MSFPEIVITGFGAISPKALNAKQLWQNICQSSCAIDTITAFDASAFPCSIAGQAPDFKIRDYVPKNYRKATKLMSRDIELSVVAADEAFASAGLITKYNDTENPTIDPINTAINLGAGLISCDIDELADAAKNCLTDGEFDIHKWGKDGMLQLTPLWLLKYLPNMLACHVGIIHDIQGPSNTTTCGEASSHIATIEAAQVIQRGQANIALAGGGESKVNPVVHLRQCLLKRSTFKGNHDPKNACRPFDAHASGSVFGEAAGILVLENLENAKKRNAKIYASIAGTGQSTSLNTNYQHLEPDGKAITIAIEKALKQADITPSEIDLIIPHGTAIPCDDLAEAAGIQNALGDAVNDIPVLPIKSLISNTGAAAGALDMIAAINAINDSIIPPAANFNSPLDGCKLNINKQKIEKKIKYALCTTYTFGGQTAAIVLKNHNG